MAIQTHETVLKDKGKNEVKIASSDFPGRQGVRMSARLGKILSSFLKAAPSGTGDNKGKKLLDRDVDFSALSTALVENLDEDHVERLILDLLTYTRVNGQEVSKPEIFDMVFAGEYGLLLGVLKFVMEVNFTSFFDEGVIGKIPLEGLITSLLK